MREFEGHFARFLVIDLFAHIYLKQRKIQSASKSFLKGGELKVFKDQIAVFCLFRRLSLTNYDDRYGASQLLRRDGARIAQLFSKLLNDVDVTV